MSDLVAEYLGLLDALLAQRVTGPLPDDVEEGFAISLNDLRWKMSINEEALVEQGIRDRQLPADVRW